MCHFRGGKAPRSCFQSGHSVWGKMVFVQGHALSVMGTVYTCTIILLRIRFPKGTKVVTGMLTEFTMPIFFVMSKCFYFHNSSARFVEAKGGVQRILGLVLITFPIYYL